jgi:hypothetical protein
VEYLVEIITDLGFPIFVAVFVLVRLEPSMRKLYDAVTALTVVIAKSNGMRESDVDSIVAAVKQRRKRGAEGK